MARKASSTEIASLAEVSKWGMAPLALHHCLARFSETCQQSRRRYPSEMPSTLVPHSRRDALLRTVNVCTFVVPKLETTGMGIRPYNPVNGGFRDRLKQRKGGIGTPPKRYLNPKEAETGGRGRNKSVPCDFCRPPGRSCCPKPRRGNFLGRWDSPALDNHHFRSGNLVQYEFSVAAYRAYDH